MSKALWTVTNPTNHDQSIVLITDQEKLIMNEESRKVRYTRRVIREAYFELLRKKTIDKITIAELCEIADIHRGTFYQHYHDIYELQEKIEADLMKKFDEVLPAIEDNNSDISEAIMLTIFEEKDACRALLGENGSSDFLKKIIDKSRKSSYVQYGRLGINKKDYNAVFTFASSGCIGVIREWLMNDYHEKPEYVLQVIRTLTRSVIEGMMR